MEDYGLVSFDPPWKWVVEKPCYVSWPDKEEGTLCLGQLSPVNSTSKLTLNIGWRSDELLIALHLPISIRASRQPLDFFMIIPCDLDTSIVDATFAPVQADKRLESVGLGDCNLFHIPFKLAASCDVVMPREKRRKPVKGTPKELISRLKSLSEVSSFDVYFRFDTYAQLELRRIFDSLASNQLKTPTIPLNSMYNGHGGALNLWVDQGLDLKLPSKRRPSPPELLQEDLSSPPPYTRDNSPILDASKPCPSKPLVEVQVPFSDSGGDTVSNHKDSNDEGVPETPFWARMQRILDYRSPSVNYQRRGRFKRAASVDSLPDARHGKKIRVCHSPSIGPLIHGTHTPLIVEINKMTAVTHHEVHSMQDNVNETALPHVVSWTCEDPVPADSDKLAIIANHELESPRDKAEEIARWLHSAWSVLPAAHHVLRSQLLALGAAQDAESSAGIRIDCSTKLAFAAARATRQDSNKSPIPETLDTEDQVREVVRWVNGVRYDADITILHDLVALAGAAMDVANSIEKGGQTMERFSVLKARCIASACVLGNTVTTA